MDIQQQEQQHHHHHKKQLDTQWSYPNTSVRTLVLCP